MATNLAIPGTIGGALHYATSLLLKDGGRVVAFTSQMPTVGYGRLKRRDDYKLINTDKEKTLYIP